MDSSVARARKLELTAYKRCHWFNSIFHSGFVLNDSQKISEISFDVNPFQINVNNNLKVITYVRDVNQSKPIQIKLKEPYNQSREVFNDDNEGFPIIYTNHTGTEGMNNYYPYSVARLIPQQIPRFTFRVDDNYNQFIGNNYFTSLTNGEVLQVAKSSQDEKYLIFKSSGSFTLTDKVIVDILVVGGGGGGGSTMAGGGGGGGVVYQTNVILNSGNYTVTVGAGGTGNNPSNTTTQVYTEGGNGGDSFIQINSSDLIIKGITYRGKGGGGGGIYNAGAVGTVGKDGGSGGGGGQGNNSGAGGSTTQGNTFFNSITNISGGNNGRQGGDNGLSGGGGGGAGSAATNINGGRGIEVDITGNKSFYAAGGGGGGNTGGLVAGIGGNNVGGDGNYVNDSGTIAVVPLRHNGVANTGSGGGGGAWNYINGVSLNGGGSGGSGVVIIRYRQQRNRIEGITPEETLIQATNTNIPITIDSQYQINYQTPVVLTKGTYETIFNNGSILFRNKKFPRPWGAYFAEDWSGTILRDSSGNGRHATTAGTITKTTASGNGANAPITYLSGGTSDNITFPSGSIPSTFTILDLTRWTNSSDTTKQQRIIDGSGSGVNWFQGHIDVGVKQLGGAYYNNVWVTSSDGDTSVAANVTDWVCTIGKNSGTAPGNILANGITKGINTGGQGGFVLTINNGNSTFQRSDWAMSCVMIWNTALTDDEMVLVNNMINDYKNTGRSIKNDLGLIFDYSYPILKDINGANINPLVWYQFDGSTASLINDASGNSYNLTNTGVTFDNTNFIKGNGSALFGSGKLLEIGTTIDFRSIQTTSGFSIQLWFRGTTTTANWGRIFAFSISPVSENANFYISRDNANTNLRFHLAADGTQTAYTTSGVNYFNGAWYHIVWTISTSGVWNVYINGVNLNVAKTQSFSATNNYNGSKRLGNSTLSEFFDGNIDDFRIYSSALTATQVSELYNGRLSIYNPPGFILGTEIEPEA